MKSLLLVFAASLFFLCAFAQEKEGVSETSKQQLENMTEANEAEPTDDSYLQQLDHYKKHPLNINAATAEQLDELNILTGLQVEQLIAYRKLLGKLVSVYELQSVPAWDIATIKKLLPYIIIADDRNLVEKLKERWNGGDRKLIARYSRVLEKAKGYDVPATAGKNYYLGNRDRYFIRYNYNYKNLLQWGVLADKDAGEQFFKGSQQQGFDFYSFHFFARKLGIIKSLAIGDFTVNLGQGLLQWQSLAFKKNADALAVKRQSAVLRPYNAAGEYNFHRGAGITLQQKNWEATAFVSYRKISANINADSLLDDGIASSFLTSGYHRTASENEDRNNLGQFVYGSNLKYSGSNSHVGINSIHYQFSRPVQKSAEPYNLFALQGSSFTNTSIDYSITRRNVHLFGEAAIDNKFNTAFINGVLISADPKIDLAIVYRKIDRAYQSINANAFTENIYPVNETGLYAAVSIRPVNVLRIDAYADIYRFPWLKYRVDAPSLGKDFLLQFAYMPNKQVEMYVRYKSETKMINRSAGTFITSLVDFVPKKDLRLQTSIVLNRQWSFASRAELVWYDTKGPDAGEGFSLSTDLNYKPEKIKWKTNLRLQYFETSGYNERIYAYESDLPYNFAIPFFYGKGMRYYLNFSYDASQFMRKRKNHSMSTALKWAQTIYTDRTVIGSGLDEINGKARSEIKLQLMMNF